MYANLTFKKEKTFLSQAGLANMGFSFSGRQGRLRAVGEAGKREAGALGRKTDAASCLAGRIIKNEIPL